LPSHTRLVALENGNLHLAWREDDWPLDQLCGFAERDNRRRGFLIVSRVLGRHVPARPSLIRQASNALSRLVPADLPGPVLFVGMAETAITLGQTVHDGWCRDTGRGDALYIHSTRQKIGREPLLRFSEPHSHASAHLLYAPEMIDGENPLADVRSLVLIDDEVTTGRTFVNLATQLAAVLPQLKQIEVAVLTDWSEGSYHADMPAPVSSHALLRGSLAWEGREPAPSVALPPTCQLGILHQRRNLGRLGCKQLELDLSPYCTAFAQDTPQSLHVIGTGELHYPAFLLGEMLEDLGHDVMVQATTRSPAKPGGEICSALVLQDNYHSGVPTFLYNVDQTAHRRRIVCHETPANMLDPALLRQSDAVPINFGAP